MVPKPPPRPGQIGFLYVAPYRIQGISVAGEQTMVQIPELDLSFDIGLCPRIALASKYIALSHGHMDHVGGLPYYFSQRMFQKMGVGTCICHNNIAGPLRRMMAGWVELEQQETQHEIIGVDPDEEIEIKNNIMLRAIEVNHTVPALGYAVIERRSKLKPEYREYPQETLREMRERGEQITNIHQIPLIAYTGDTELGPALLRNEFAQAKIVISECTFFDPDHKERASVGKHLHVDDLATLLEGWQAQAIVLVHLSRRTNLNEARERLIERVGPKQAERVHFLMDHRRNRRRYEQQSEGAMPVST